MVELNSNNSFNRSGNSVDFIENLNLSALNARPVISGVSHPEDNMRLDTSEVIKNWIKDVIAQATGYGRHIVVAYSYSPGNRSGIDLLVTSRRLFGKVCEEFSEDYPNQYLSLGIPLNPTQAAHLVSLHRAIRQHSFSLPEFDSRDLALREIVRNALNDLFPSQWYARAFLLFDICNFSTRPSAEQVTLRLLLDTAVRKAYQMLVKNCKTGTVDTLFNLIPTGDGFYIWNKQAGRKHDAFTLALAVLTHAQLKQQRWSSINLHVRSAFTIGLAYTLPTSSIIGSTDTPTLPDAIGPALNNVARLCAAAAPNQILISDFRINDDIIQSPRELVIYTNWLMGDSDFVLRLSPENRFKISDKHGITHYCYNLEGSAFYYLGSAKHVIKVGLAPDYTVELNPKSFN